jgi:hypothetical protein
MRLQIWARGIPVSRSHSIGSRVSPRKVIFGERRVWSCCCDGVAQRQFDGS